MNITRVKYHNGITELSYQEQKESGMDEFTLRSGDEPLPAFRNVLMFLRVFVLRMLELPDTDEEIRKVTVRSVKFDYAENGTLGAVISAVRELKLSRGLMVLNTPHRFEEAGDETMLIEGKCIEHLNTLIEEAEKYINGERSQEQMQFDAKDEIKDSIAKNAEKPGEKAGNNGKNLSDKTVGSLYVKSKGDRVTIAAGYANRLTAMVNEPKLLVQLENKKTFRIGNGSAILFKKIGNILEIISVRQDDKTITGKKMTKNVVEDIIMSVEDWCLEIKEDPSKNLKIV